MIYFCPAVNANVKLLRKRESGVNTFIECDEFGNPTLKIRSWQFANKTGHAKPEKQVYIISEPYGNKIISVEANKQLTIF